MTEPLRKHCATCAHWDPTDGTLATSESGNCCFHPPKLLTIREIDPNTDYRVDTIVSRFPTTERSTWCSKWEADTQGVGE